MDLSTNYLGLSLRNPLLVGASPFCDSIPSARELEDAGAAALTMRSLFEEQLLHPEPAFPSASYQLDPESYLRHLEKLKKALRIPVVASLNATASGAWTNFAPRLEEAGADAIELNFYRVVTDPAIGADDVEAEMIKAVDTVARGVSIPIAVKLSPYHSSIAQLATALELAGAAGTVIFNRFYQPDVNVEAQALQPVLRLSEPGELLLRLRWLAILSPLLRGSLAVTGGVHGSDDVVKALLSGADCVQIVSALLQTGPACMGRMLRGLESWMHRRGYACLADFRGLLDHRRSSDAAVIERAGYVRTLQNADPTPRSSLFPSA